MMMRENQHAGARTKNNGAGLTRRNLFQRAGFAMAAAALPAGLATAEPRAHPARATDEQSISPVMARLSTYMSEARTRALPDEVVEATKQHVLDTLAAMVSGSELLPGRDAIKFTRAYGGEKVATVVASDVLCGPIEAALANGMLAHSDETDDSFAPAHAHPGCSIVPAALAAGERFGVDGTSFLRAVTLGYDVGTRVTMTLGASHFMTRGHKSTHSVAGVFGSAAAAGSVANLSAQQMRWLLDYTAQQSSGIAAWQRDTQHIEKAFVFAGMPARSGVTAALLVQAGWTGIDDIFSGPDNFFLAYAPQADPAGLIERLGERYNVMGTQIKKWPVGSPIQAPLDAIEILRKRHPFEADQVAQVRVREAAFLASIVNNRTIPDICLQHIIAVMLIDKTVTFHSANDQARMKDSGVLRQRAKVTLIPDEQLQRLMPLREAIVEITLTNGTHLTQRVDNVRGTPANPMTRDELAAKARDLITPVLGQTDCTKLIDRVFAMEGVKDIRQLRPLLQRTALRASSPNRPV
ncbi:MAG: MmgE/PrpD family protein [Terriglobia bacterium]